MGQPMKVRAEQFNLQNGYTKKEEKMRPWDLRKFYRSYGIGRRMLRSRLGRPKLDEPGI